jgi:tetratricopeptide (TPR) repeat protein
MRLGKSNSSLSKKKIWTIFIVALLFLGGVGIRFSDQTTKFLEPKLYAIFEVLLLHIIPMQEETLGPDHPDVAKALYLLGGVYKLQERYLDAHPPLKRALKIQENFYGKGNHKTADNLITIADLYSDQGRLVEAEIWFKRALGALEGEHGLSHADINYVLNILALRYDINGRFSEAEPLFRRSLEVLISKHGSEHINVAEGLNRLAANLGSQGRRAEAVPLLKNALSILEKELGLNDPSVEEILSKIADNYYLTNNYAKAAPLFERLLIIRQNNLGRDNPGVAKTLDSLAHTYFYQRRFDEAEIHFKRLLTIQDKVFGPNHPKLAETLISIGSLYRELGEYGEDEKFLNRALKIREDFYGSEHSAVLRVREFLGSSYSDQGRYAEAENMYTRVLEIREKKLGLSHPNLDLVLNNLSQVYAEQGKYPEAEVMQNRAMEIDVDTFGIGSPEVAHNLNNLAYIYSSQGHFQKAVLLFDRYLNAMEKINGPDHLDVATALSNLATIYDELGHYTKAEPLHRRALRVREKLQGENHPDLARGLDNLAANYNDQGRNVEAALLSARSLKIREVTLAPDHPDIAMSLLNVAYDYEFKGRYNDAKKLLKRSQVIFEKTFGAEHPFVADNLMAIANNYSRQNHFEEAEPLYTRALAIYEKVFSPNHPKLANNLNLLALSYGRQGRYAKKGALLQRVLKIRQTSLGASHPLVAASLFNLAKYLSWKNNYRSALEHIRRSTAILKKRLVAPTDEKLSVIMREQIRTASYHKIHVQIIFMARNELGDASNTLTHESFEAGQLANVTSAGSAISRMAARFAAGDDDLAKLVRSRQDAVNGWQALDKKLVKTFSRPPGKRNNALEENLRNQLKVLDQRIGDTGQQLSKRFPEYTALTSREPVTMVKAQSLLSADEALISYLTGDEASYLWVLRKDSSAFHRIEMKGSEVTAAVKEIRGSLDPSGVTKLSDVKPFDTTKAYELYEKLFAPAEKHLEGVRHVMVVPNGALQSLPLGVLVTEKPQGSFTDFSGYRQVPWLAKKYALSVLPSVGSLKALRMFAKKGKSEEPFKGFGDPILDGTTNSRGGVELAALFSRGPVVDVTKLQNLGRLPDTADELRAIANTLGADDSSLYLAERATESQVKDLDLSNTQIVSFATHGLITGQLKGVQEPGLVLTPPTKGTSKDDGYLTASEIAQLKLNADWVILSACNTASSDGKPGAEGLSGLAKAFFYAGSRALLVSHWPVLSQAATQLTTRMLKEAKDKTVGRAEALKRSMIAMMNDTKTNYLAHPMFWAPFVVVGEGK